MKIDSIRLIEELSNANGVSGFEDEVLCIARSYTERHCDIDEDKIRNLYFRNKRNKKDRLTVMIDGHSDEVGFMVQSIEKNGTLKFIPIGGWNSQVVLGQRVRVRNRSGKYLKGTISAKPPHFMQGKEMNEVTDILSMTIDLGATSKEDVTENYQIEIGAPIVPDTAFSFNEQSGILMGKAFDCRLGCAAVIETMAGIKDLELPLNVVGTLSAQEEVGMRGAKVSSRTVNPDIAIIFEGTPADDTHLDIETAQAALKKGPQLRHIDTGMITNPRFARFAQQMARKKNIPYQDAVRSKGATNASAVNLNGNGVPSIVIGIPVRYIHTPFCLAAISDYKHAISWCHEILTSLSDDIIRGF